MLPIRTSVFLLVLTAFGIGMAGCEHTIRGAGQDIADTGEAVEDAVEAQ
jgi:predicted small secreted protein